MIEARDDQLLNLATSAHWWKPMLAWFNALQLRSLCECDVTLSGRVLDLGCGDGGVWRLLSELQLLAAHAYGIDISAIELTKARRLGAHRALVRADGGRLPFRDNTFSSAACIAMLGSAPRGPDPILAEIHRVLEPGGMLLATVPTDVFNSIVLWPHWLDRISPALSRRYLGRLNRRLPHFTVRSADGWQALLASHDMDVLDMRPFLSRREGYVWSVLALQVVRVLALLRLSRSRIVERITRSVVKNALARFFQPARVAPGDAGFVAIAARRRRGSQDVGASRLEASVERATAGST